MKSRVAIVLAATLLGAAILATGVYGTYSYVHNYIVYRGFPAPTECAGCPAGKLVRVRFFSHALRRQDSYLIYLPAGYDAQAAAGVRFPVLYLLHGTVSGGLHYINVGNVGVDSDYLVHTHQVRPFLIVMPEAQDGSFVDDTEWANTPHGRYESAVLEAVRRVDSRFSTIRNRRSRAIAGLSMGGFGATNIALRHPHLFATFESWSGYFTEKPSGVFSGASAALLRANSPALYAPSERSLLRRLPMHALIYGGVKDTVTQQQGPFAHQLHALGVPVRTLTFAGTHSWRLWRGEMPLALRFASRWLVGP